MCAAMTVGSKATHSNITFNGAKRLIAQIRDAFYANSNIRVNLQKSVWMGFFSSGTVCEIVGYCGLMSTLQEHAQIARTIIRMIDT